MGPGSKVTNGTGERTAADDQHQQQPHRGEDRCRAPVHGHNPVMRDQRGSAHARIGGRLDREAQSVRREGRTAMPVLRS